MNQRKSILLIDGIPELENAKTAANIIRYRPQQVAAILDRNRSGQTSASLFGIGGDIPVIAHLYQAPEADTLIIGVATSGGVMPEPMRQVVRQAICRGMKIVSGLHQFLSDDPEFKHLAETHGAKLVDLRKNRERKVANLQGISETCLRIHTIGQDCNVGKMLVSLELSRALQREGHDAKFVATGQTGMIIEGDGCPIDAVVADFINGAAERLVLTHQHHAMLIIEGQGTLVHPRYSAVTLGLLHGCRPHGLILCYEPGRQGLSGMDFVALTPLPKLIELYEAMASAMQPCRVIGIAMNTSRLSASQAAQERRRMRDESGLPVADVIRDGPNDLLRAILTLKAKVIPE